MNKLQISKNFGFMSASTVVRGKKYYAAGSNEQTAILELVRKLEKAQKEAEDLSYILDTAAERLYNKARRM